MKWTLRPLSLTLVLAGASPVQAADGAALYDKTCSSCHGKDVSAALKVIHLAGLKLIHPKLDFQPTAS